MQAIIQFSHYFIIVLINYKAIKGVYNRINLYTFNIFKANIRLVHALIYFS
jgi:hypothetical protein